MKSGKKWRGVSKRSSQTIQIEEKKIEGKWRGKRECVIRKEGLRFKSQNEKLGIL